MKKQYQAPMKAIEAIDAGNDVDPGILAFGTSVSVNDDLRRSIGHEIQQMNANCSHIKEELSREKRIHDELAKIKLHSEAEVLRLRQGAADGLDTLNMSIQILQGLERTLTSEIFFNHEADQEATEAPKEPNSFHEFHDGNKDRSKEIAELQATLTLKLRKLRDVRINRNEIMKENELMKNQIEVELVGPLAKLRESNKIAQETLAAELARVGSLKGNIKEVVERNEQTKMLFEKNVEELAALKDRLVKEVKEAHHILKAMEEKRQHEQGSLIASENELKNLQSATGAMKMQVEEAQQLIKERDKVREDREQNHSSYSKLFTENEELLREISLLKHELDAERQNQQNFDNEKLSIEKKKEENDRLEAETIIPSQSEINELKAEKEQLDSFIATYISDGRNEMEKVTSEIVSKKNQISDLENELDIVMKDIDTKKSMVLEQKVLLDDYNDAVLQERSEIETKKKEIVQQLNEIELKMKHLEENKKQKIQNDEDELWKVQRKLDILQEGKSMLEETARQESILLKSVSKM